jgi:RNA polymerase sigma factor (sigma-70 family)
MAGSSSGSSSQPLASESFSPRAVFLPIESLLLDNLELIHNLVRCFCRRHRVSPEEGEELESEIRVKLLENDHRLLRQCGSTSKLPRYLGQIVASTWHDRLRKLKGRMKRPSRTARELGPVAERLESLLGRGETVESAYERLKHEFPHLTPEDLGDLEERVKPRAARRIEGEETLAGLAAPDSGGCQRLERQERQARKRLALFLMAKYLAEVPDEDRRLLVRACAGGVKISRIARSLGLEQKPLYRRIDRRLAELRQKLEAAGVRWRDLREELGIDEPV